MQREREILEKVREIGEEEGQQVVQDVTRRLPPPKITQAGPVRRMHCCHMKSYEVMHALHDFLPCFCGLVPIHMLLTHRVPSLLLCMRAYIHVLPASTSADALSGGNQFLA